MTIATAAVDVPTLQSGDHLTREEFIRIWKQLPHIKRAELIRGIVYMASPTSADHGDMDFNMVGILSYYRMMTPGCLGGSNTTTYMLHDSSVQPDIILRLIPECGGESWIEDSYINGSPELLTEISYSSASIDLHEKLELYEKAKIAEYVVVVVRKQAIRWHRLSRGKYRLIEPDANGVYRSRIFPGLWLDSVALFANDMSKVYATLQEGIASDEHKKFVAELAKRMKAIK